MELFIFQPKNCVFRILVTSSPEKIKNYESFFLNLRSYWNRRSL